jgi:23S rRNA (cytidine1920-2'-O)/16S rRNA (cytidine1409-2'-O)-methyltransferase
MVTAGRVFVNGVSVRKASQDFSEDAEIVVLPAVDFVSRAGHKLAHALELFSEIDVQGQNALDVGASTGGFTDVLLRNGANNVVAIDVGHDQIVEGLRDNSRVIVVEGFNARHLSVDALAQVSGLRNEVTAAGAPKRGGLLDFGIVVADLSFISLTLVLKQMLETAPNAEFILLVKPQFEVGKQSLEASGVVKDHRLRAQAIDQVVDFVYANGAWVHGIERSPMPGTHGNVEYLLWISARPGEYRSEWSQRIESLAKEGK